MAPFVNLGTTKELPITIMRFVFCLCVFVILVKEFGITINTTKEISYLELKKN